MIQFRITLPALLAQVRNCLTACELFPGLVVNSDSILKLISQLEQGYEDADRPLRILLAGGTGVGKSMLLNALAGAQIAESGPIRPTTRNFTAYLYESDTDTWINTLDKTAICTHNRAELKSKLIIDAPDADSSVLAHRNLLEKAIALADLIIVVSTSEKYVSDTVMELLQKYRSGRRFAFVMNKCDHGYDEPIVRDFEKVLQQAGFSTSQVFVVSARNAFINRTENPETKLETHDFHAFEQFIGEQLTAMKIQEIRRLNLLERAQLLADLLEKSLPENYRTIASEWTAAYEAELQRFFVEFNARLRGMMLNREELRPVVAGRRATGFTGLFGLAANLIYFLKRIIANDTLLDTPEEIFVRIQRRLNADVKKSLDYSVDKLRSACIAEASRLGLSAAVLENKPEYSAPSELASVPKWLGDQAIPIISGRLMDTIRLPGKFLNRLLNLPAWSWIAFWIYRMLQPLFNGQSPPFEALPGAGIVLLVILSAEWMIVDKFIAASTDRIIEKIISATLADLTQQFRATFTPPLDSFTENIRECTRSLSDVIQKLR